MRTDKKLDEIIKELMDKLDDDEEFCTAEYDAVQEYCGKRKYQISDEDLHTIKAIGLENVFDGWKEEQKGKDMTFDAAKQRPDYHFFLYGIEDLIEEIRNNRMKNLLENGDPYRGVAVLEVGYVDIEVNITTSEQCGKFPTSKAPIISYFACRKHGDRDDDWESDDYVDEHDPEVDWYAENWMELLEKDMYEALEDYVIIHELSFDKPN